MTAPIWTPSAERIAATEWRRFATRAADGGARLDPTDSASLHDWSVRERAAFWQAVWDDFGVLGDPGRTVLADADRFPGARFFPDAHLNFAENLLRRDDDTPAIVFRSEAGLRREWSWAELGDTVASLADALAGSGVGTGDVVAAWMPNVPETVATMLAAAALGATFTSTSPDFGPQGVLDRFGQLGPKVFVCADGYIYGGKRHSCLDRLDEILAGLPTVQLVIIVPYLAHHGDEIDFWSVRNAVVWDEFLQEHPPVDVPYAGVGFDHPLYVLYSSGTTGVPKCIEHRAGGILLKHLSEHRLHCDIRPGDRVFYFTTAGWMMWNWLASALASDATLVLYDGSPFHGPDGPGPQVLFDLVAEEHVTLFGTSAKWIDAFGASGMRPIDTHDLSALRTVCSTGSPLAPGGFDVVYERIATDVHLASISGGTDICGCFVAGDPTRPVWRGEIQSPALGMDVAVFGDDAAPVAVGETGELVCRAAFPSVPLGFRGDTDASRFHDAYFARFDGVWCHGDWIAQTEHGGYVITGRSDATLNPGGVRIGTAELYRVVEHFDAVAEAVAVGQPWDGDVRVVLFVRLAEGATLDDDLVGRIRTAIRTQCSPRHVPAKVLAVTDIPRTRSGKISELAVRDVVIGRTVANVEALANPDALAQFADRAELAD